MLNEENWLKKFYKKNQDAKLLGTLNAIEKQLKSMNALLALLVAKSSEETKQTTLPLAGTATQWLPTIQPKHTKEVGL